MSNFSVVQFLEEFALKINHASSDWLPGSQLLPDFVAVPLYNSALSELYAVFQDGESGIHPPVLSVRYWTIDAEGYINQL